MEAVNDKMNIKMLVALHKQYWLPKDDVYLPIHVGLAGQKELWGYTGDDSGENISSKNKYFCELTALFWAYKNLKCDYIGLCHYRRYFIDKRFGLRIHILSRLDYEKIFSDGYDIVLPLKDHLQESVFNQYIRSHHEKDLLATRKIIFDLYPEFIKSFDDVMSGNEIYFFNMFCMKKNSFDAYCKWLFSILFELEKEIDVTDYDTYQKRVFGYIAERLMIVWVRANKYKVKEYEIMSLEQRGIKHKILRMIQKIIY